MEELKHFSHKHPLILSEYSNSPADALCSGCGDPILINTYVYLCIATPRFNTGQDYSCTHYFLHKTCSILPPNLEFEYHPGHMLTLQSITIDTYIICVLCDLCGTDISKLFFYGCTSCSFTICVKCSLPEFLDLNHASHNHTLTLLPMRSSHFCRACGTEGSKDFSYLCKTCLFWIHKSCATALPQLIFKAHHHDHPLVLDYSLPEAYLRFRVSCDLCREHIHQSLWLYYCADCRYFAHVKCVLSAIKSGKDLNMPTDVGDVDDIDLVHFPISDNKPFLLYQLIQKFAEYFSTSTDERSEKTDNISHCRNGHLLVSFDDFHSKNDAESESSDHMIMICDGCVQPILPPPDSFYGCLDCNFFLHSICAAELPWEIQHVSHPEHKLIRCDQTRKLNSLFTCIVCENTCSGMFYSCDSCDIRIDLVCAAMPGEIKHDSHKHKLKFYNENVKTCCDVCGGNFFSGYKCEICKYQIHIGCARKPGRIMHRWDEHQLCLMYPPVKGHPHDFDCERCSKDINPFRWFYHCCKCDTSFHVGCLDQSAYTNIKLGGIVKVDDLHQHSLKIAPRGPNFKCGRCDYYNESYFQWERWPILTCVSCKFSVCGNCAYRKDIKIPLLKL